MAAHRRQRPTFEEEQAFAHAGARFVAGVDEVGRGPLAGPVVAAAVILPLDWIAAGKSGEAGSANPREMLNDSKKLSPRWREQLHGIIVKTAIAWGGGSVSVRDIECKGIAPATRLAMKRAVAKLSCRPDALLIDAMDLSDLGFPCKSLIRGDERCGSIAAASIVAKVTRDRLMSRMDRRYPGYGFARNKGYGTREHIAWLRRFGPCAIHRKNFAPVRDMVMGPDLL